MPTTIKKCSCKHEAQDQMYGQGNRVYNIGVNQFRCSVCSFVIKGETKVKAGSAPKEK
jgi:hypothetical protein